MKYSTLAALLVSIATPGHGAAAPQAIEALQPAVSLCATYLSTYLVPVTIGGSSTSRPTAQSTPLTIPASGSSVAPSPSTTTSPTPNPVISSISFSIVPIAAAKKRSPSRLDHAKRGLAKRSLGGYLGIGATPNPSDCGSASFFDIGGGELFFEGEVFFGSADIAFKAFGAPGAAPEGAITTTLDIPGGRLRWLNSAFTDGEVFFCQVADSGQVYFVFSADQSTWPDGCEEVNLQSFPGKFFHL